MKQIVVVTGASSGLGHAIATLLASRGEIVYGTSRQPDPKEEGFHKVAMDVTDEGSVKEAINKIIGTEGKIDVVVNNAGMGIGGAIENFSDEEAFRQLNTNFLGLSRVCRAVLPGMRLQRKGKIINISSLGGLIGLPFQGFYSASKFAVEGFSEALATEVRSWNIRVIVINPGDFKTRFTQNRVLTAIDAVGSDYSRWVERAVTKMSQDEQGGCDPILVASKVARIIRKKTPRYRYLAGRFDQLLAVYLKPLLPPAWFRRIIGSHYGA